MIGKPRILAAVVAAVIAAGMATGHELRAGEQTNQAAQEVRTLLLKSPVTGMPGKEVNIVHLTVPPGFVTAHHYHPGQLFIYVVDGSITVVTDGMAPVKLGPGDVFEEPPGKPMVGKNLSSTHGAELVVFDIGGKGEPLMVEMN